MHWLSPTSCLTHTHCFSRQALLSLSWSLLFRQTVMSVTGSPVFSKLIYFRSDPGCSCTGCDNLSSSHWPSQEVWQNVLSLSWSCTVPCLLAVLAPGPRDKPTTVYTTIQDYRTILYKHRWALTSILMSAISDIDICYSDIGDKYVGLKTVIPISEVLRYRHQSPLRYPTFTKNSFSSAGFKPTTLETEGERSTIQLRIFSSNERDVGYRISDKTSFRYPI